MIGIISIIDITRITFFISENSELKKLKNPIFTVPW